MGSWVKVEYLEKKKKQEFIGEIRAIVNDLYDVKFLNKSTLGEFFVFPDKDDTFFIEKSQIKEILNEPICNNRGQYFFDKVGAPNNAM